MESRKLSEIIDDFYGLKKVRSFIYNPTVFTLITGADAVLDEVLSYQAINIMKNTYYAGVDPTHIQDGMLRVDSGTGRIMRRHSGATAAATADKIDEGDSYVEVIDTGTGYIIVVADGSEVARFKVVGNTQPLQPCFHAYLSATVDNVTGDGTIYTIALNSEKFDKGGNFNTSLYKFVASVPGQYLFLGKAAFAGISSHNFGWLKLSVTGQDYTLDECDPNKISRSPGADAVMKGGIIIDLNTNDEVVLKISIYIYPSSGSKVIDIIGGLGQTYLCGFLLS